MSDPGRVAVLVADDPARFGVGTPGSKCDLSGAPASIAICLRPWGSKMNS